MDRIRSDLLGRNLSHYRSWSVLPFSLRSIGCIVVKYSIRLFKCFHFFMAQCDLEVIQGHEKCKCLFVWLFVQLNSVLLRITRMRYSFQCSYARLPLDDNHKMKWAYSEFLNFSPKLTFSLYQWFILCLVLVTNQKCIICPFQSIYTLFQAQ